MPRDWLDHPVVLERHCGCRWRARPDHPPDTPLDEDAFIRDARDCPLHSLDPRHDLPEGL